MSDNRTYEQKMKNLTTGKREEELFMFDLQQYLIINSKDVALCQTTKGYNEKFDKAYHVDIIAPDMTTGTFTCFDVKTAMPNNQDKGAYTVSHECVSFLKGELDKKPFNINAYKLVFKMYGKNEGEWRIFNSADFLAHIDEIKMKSKYNNWYSINKLSKLCKYTSVMHDIEYPF